MLSTAPAEAASCCPPQAPSRLSYGAALRTAGAAIQSMARGPAPDGRRSSCLVPTARLELAQLSPLPPQDSVSTNFTTSAGGETILPCAGFLHPPEPAWKRLSSALGPVAGESFQALHSNPRSLICSMHNFKKTQESARSQADYFGTAGPAGAEAAAAAGADAPAGAEAGVGCCAAPITPSEAVGL